MPDFGIAETLLLLAATTAGEVGATGAAIGGAELAAAGTAALGGAELAGGGTALGLTAAEGAGAGLGGLGAAEAGLGGLGAAGEAGGAFAGLGLETTGAGLGAAEGGALTASEALGAVFGPGGALTEGFGSGLVDASVIGNLAPETVVGAPLGASTTPTAGVGALNFAPTSGISAGAGATDLTAAGGGIDLAAYGGTSPALSPAASAGTPGALTAADGSMITQSIDASNAAETGSSGSFLDKLVTGAANNPLKTAGIGLGAAGLGYSLMNANKKLPGEDALGAQNQDLAAQSRQLRSGELLPGQQQSLDEATKAAKARVTSNYASRGMPADPSKNSALAAELSSIDRNAVAAKAQMVNQLLQTGIQEAQLSNDLYKFLIGQEATRDANVGKAIAGFASAMSGAPTINIGSRAA